MSLHKKWCRVCGAAVETPHAEHIPFKERVRSINVDRHSLLTHDIQLREEARRNGK